jgi:hypothetical protein
VGRQRGDATQPAAQSDFGAGLVTHKLHPVDQGRHQWQAPAGGVIRCRSPPTEVANADCDVGFGERRRDIELRSVGAVRMFQHVGHGFVSGHQEVVRVLGTGGRRPEPSGGGCSHHTERTWFARQPEVQRAAVDRIHPRDQQCSVVDGCSGPQNSNQPIAERLDIGLQVVGGQHGLTLEAA